MLLTLMAVDISEDLRIKIPFFLNLKHHAEGFFKSRNYGESLKNVYVGFICVNPRFDPKFHKETFSFKRKLKELQYGITLNHDVIMNSDDAKIKEHIKNCVIYSLPKIKNLTMKDFDYDEFVRDMELFFVQFK